MPLPIGTRALETQRPAQLRVLVGLFACMASTCVMGQTWECRLHSDSSPSKRPLVVLSVDQDDATARVRMVAADKEYVAVYGMRSQGHWWAFGPDDAYGFLIQQDGTGYRYVMADRGRDGVLNPRQVYVCIAGDAGRNEVAR